MSRCKIINHSSNPNPARPKGVELGGYEVMADIKSTERFAHKGYGWKIKNNSIVIKPNGLAFVGCGLAVEIPQGLEIIIRQICDVTQHGMLAIDDVVQANHKGEIYIMLHNISGSKQIISQGDIIAEIVVQRASVGEIIFLDM